jgi:hypothetical protein
MAIDRRAELYEFLKTVLDPQLFSFDDAIKKVGVKAPINPEDVKNLTDFVKSMLKNVLKPDEVATADRTIGAGTFKIFGGYVDIDRTLRVNERGELGVAEFPANEDVVCEQPKIENYVVSVGGIDGGFKVVSVVDGVETVEKFGLDKKEPESISDLKKEVEALKLENGEIRKQMQALKRLIEESIESCVKG